MTVRSPSPTSGPHTLLTSFDYLLNTSFNKGQMKQSPNYGVSLKTNKGSEKQQSAARGRKNGDSNPQSVLAFSIAVTSGLGSDQIYHVNQ
ncbi:hypothetical protein HAV15_011580 [Penicillium sp. str. |nr:hypothetical protein HAV15_011580 [Penicillium sp. str. \